MCVSISIYLSIYLINYLKLRKEKNAQHTDNHHYLWLGKEMVEKWNMSFSYSSFLKQEYI